MDKPILVKLNEDQLDELSLYLLGSNMTLDQGLSVLELTIEQIDPSSFDDIDSEMFRCDWCGWWCDASDNVGDQCCCQCASEGKDLSEENSCDDMFIDNADSALDDGDDE